VSKKKFKILATDGTWIKEFVYFLQTSHGDIYYGEINLDQPDKTSRHVSGISHNKRGERLIKLGKGLKLTEYVGLHQLFVMSIGKLVFQSPPFGRIYSKRTEGNVLIDINKFDLRVGIMAFLLEPNRLDTLEKLSEKLKDVDYTINKETTPWLVIAIFNDGIEIDKNAVTPIEWNKALIRMEIPSSESAGHLVMITAPAKK
jgi:hypothetical protein